MLGGARIVDQRIEASPRGRGRDDLLQSSSRETSPCTTTTSAPAAAAEIGGILGFLLAGGIVDHDARAVLGQDGRGRCPRPDADPVTTAHKPSFDIPIPFMFVRSGPDLPYRPARMARKSSANSKMTRIRKILLRGIMAAPPSLHAALAGGPADIGACLGSGFSPSCGARKDRSRCPAQALKPEVQVKNEERRGGE